MRLFRTPQFTSAALVACAVWPVIMGLLWVTTARTVPLIKVRWVPGVADEQRTATERELSLVWRDSTEPRTVTYLLMDADRENLRRIVQHPLVEDTAFIDRAAYALTNAPAERTWAGDRFTASWPWALLYVSVFGLVASLIPLLYRSRDQRTYAALRPVLLCVLWLGAFVFTVSSFVFLNDHFDRISRARQIARYGEWPFRDFLDPGYYMTEFVSAGLQLLLGDSLLGDLLLSAVCIATGTVLVARLSLHVSQSILTALGASLIALLMLPRGYDFDKVLFYPLAVALCWRYIDVPTTKRVWAIAAGAVIAALFRYDTGVYTVGAAVVAIVAVHAGDWITLWRRLGMLAAAVACLSLPVLVVLQLTAGVSDAVDQVVTYAIREGAGTRIVTPPALNTDAWSFENANALLYYLFHALPLAAILVLTLKTRSGSASRNEVAKVACLIVLCITLNLFILRYPVVARVGGMSGPAAILAAWILHSVWQVRRPAALLLRTASVLVLSLFVWSVSTAVAWEEQLTAGLARPSRFSSVIRIAAASPPDPDLIGSRASTALVLYLRECTRPTDRILATFFAPDIAFYAQRGFAGGLAALSAGHWSEPRFQQRSLQSLTTHPPALVIQRSRDTEFRQGYPLLAGYISTHYRAVGTTEALAGPGPESLLLLVRNDRAASGTHSASALPCFR